MSKSTAKQRIDKLFDQAGDVADEHPERANRYVQLAWKIKLKANESFSKEQKMRYCKQCRRYLTADNLRVRCNNGVLTRTCRHCNTYQRIRYHDH